ncbi:hypothetical protein HDV00_008576 [Rhizophlyctis rosea]|nr:hypothetical protein HDV00_008576 [Rhizophlyctis rosea]
MSKRAASPALQTTSELLAEIRHLQRRLEEQRSDRRRAERAADSTADTLREVYRQRDRFQSDVSRLRGERDNYRDTNSALSSELEAVKSERDELQRKLGASVANERKAVEQAKQFKEVVEKAEGAGVAEKLKELADLYVEVDRYWQSIEARDMCEDAVQAKGAKLGDEKLGASLRTLIIEHGPFKSRMKDEATRYIDEKNAKNQSGLGETEREKARDRLLAKMKKKGPDVSSHLSGKLMHRLGVDTVEELKLEEHEDLFLKSLGELMNRQYQGMISHLLAHIGLAMKLTLSLVQWACCSIDKTCRCFEEGKV